ncbi:hypothetical protein GCM10010489_37570 [Microbacterium saperdae]|nr:hypothetical protein GCM10010489_37570 [Microbacterium saperdae]
MMHGANAAVSISTTPVIGSEMEARSASIGADTWPMSTPPDPRVLLSARRLTGTVVPVRRRAGVKEEVHPGDLGPGERRCAEGDEQAIKSVRRS